MAHFFVTRGVLQGEVQKRLPLGWETHDSSMGALSSRRMATLTAITIDGEEIDEPVEYDFFHSSEQFFLIQLVGGSDPASLALPVEQSWSFLFQADDDTLKVAWNSSQITITSKDPGVSVRISAHAVLAATLPNRLALKIAEVRPASLADLAKVIKEVRQAAKS